MTDISEQRELGAQALGECVTKPQNVTILEKCVYDAVKNSNYEYLTVLYQVIGDILAGKRLNDVVKSVKMGQIGWEHVDYTQHKRELDEQDKFSENPIEIEEGVEKCKNCKSTRVYSYSLQTRSADEGMSTYCNCMQCGAKWTHTG
jgi:DNA-directed RNA polymerase subunit M/transcription elongation factor TFIIS